MSQSLLPIIEVADNFPAHSGPQPYPSSHPSNGEVYTPFHLTLPDYLNRLLPVGLLRAQVLEAIQADYGSVSEDKERPALEFKYQGQDNEKVECVHFADWVLTQNKASEVINALAERWRDEGRFPGPLGGWRNEQYSVYADPGSSGLKSYNPSKAFSNAAFTLERSACALFGFATFGVHMTVYEGEGASMKIWVPRRSATKPTWPSRLDNSVAGGIPAGMSPMDSMVKECDEEASLPADLVRAGTRMTGVTTYFYFTDDGYLQPEVEYIYDLKLPEQDDPSYVRPHPHDDEVESFALLSIPEVMDALRSGQFKPNCGLILVDFLIRHGFVTPEVEPRYMEIAWRMHRRLGVAVPS